MTQGSRKEKSGSGVEAEINSGAENTIFDSQIVPVWASTKVAAKILGITPNALRIRKCRGEVECRYFGRYLRFNVNQLETLFREKQHSRAE